MERLRLIMTVLLLLLVGALIGSAVSQFTTTPPSAVEPPPEPLLDGRRVRVEVLNAGGVPGAARAATRQLRDRTFDVVFFGNAAEFDREASTVLARTGDLDAARAVADALRIRNVLSEPDTNLYLDVSVLLGRDWVPEERAEPSDEPEPRPWWDPRGWLPG